MPLKIKQRDITDCGAACIASIASYYHLHLPVARIRQLASTDQKGTNILGLVEAFEKLGFQAKGVKGTTDSLKQIPKPAIAHIIIKDTYHHFVVICKVSSASIKIMDPRDGRFHKLTLADFAKVWSGVLIILQPGDSFKQGTQTTSLFTRLWALARPHKLVMITAFIGAIAYTVIGLSTSIYLQKVVDQVLPNRNHYLLNLMSAGMILLLVLQTAIGSLKSVMTLRTGQAIDVRLILGYYQHLLRLPQQFFDTMRVGEIISRVNDAVKIRAYINEALTVIAVNVLIVVLSFLLMFTYHWRLALTILSMVPLYFVIYAITNFLNKSVERKLMESSAELESQLVESLNAASTIKSFGLESHSNIKTKVRFARLLEHVYISGKNSIFTGTSSEFLSRLFTIILLWAGAGFALEKEITVGELLSFYALLGFFTGPVSSLIGSNKLAQNALIAADRLFEIMDLEIEKQGSPISPVQSVSGAIRFMDVHYRYGARLPMLENFNLEIPASKVTAIIGESGSGKTTLVALIQKLYPLQSGKIMFGGCDLQCIPTDQVRKLVRVVPQKIDLFSGDVLENIAIGDHQPDLQKVIEICSRLGILEFIEHLPKGFSTQIGENGLTLSGGQKQRIAIARALYRDPEVLILDEATSSLDSFSEKYVHNMINLLREQQKTVIVITHRLTAVLHADKIVVLERGKIAEEGTHDDLIGRKQAYYRLWKEQIPMWDQLKSTSI